MSTENVSATPKIQLYDPAIVKLNPAISARKGEPAKSKVDMFADNMMERREANRPHQIMPGVVRVLEDGTVEVLVGRHRLAAEVKLNSMLGEGMEPFQFLAVAVPSTDEQALLDAIEENEYRVASSPFDRGESAKKLADLGYSQKLIGQKFGIKQSTVSSLIQCADLPKKIQAAFDAGKITEEALMIIASYNSDKVLQDELFGLAAQESQARKDVEARAAARAKGEVVEAEPEKSEETETDTPTTGKKSSVPKSTAVTGKKKKKTSDKITGSDVKSAVAKKGAGKKKSAPKDKGRSKMELLKFWQAIAGEKVTEEVPDTWREFAERQEMFLDGDISETQFRNTVTKCFKEKFAASKAA